MEGEFFLPPIRDELTIARVTSANSFSLNFGPHLLVHFVRTGPPNFGHCFWKERNHFLRVHLTEMRRHAPAPIEQTPAVACP
jgi:hypothetical protein